MNSPLEGLFAGGAWRSPSLLGVVTPIEMAFFFTAIFVVFFFTAAAFFTSWYLDSRRPSLSPYSGRPLRYATDISFYQIEKVMRYLYDLKQYENRPFSLARAAFCRDTGRLFPSCVSWLGTIILDWTFLTRRCRGIYVSWGSLTEEQQQRIRKRHSSLDGFQTAFSCPNPSPRAITPEYAFTKPGPLYVELETHWLLGWKCVPDTDLEVLVVQKPLDPSALLPVLPKNFTNLGTGK